MSHGVNEPLVVRHEYESEDRFLARRLSTWAELDGPLVEDRALDALVEQQPRRVLEVGCGTGDFSARVRDALRGVFLAVDLSHRMAALARARGLIAQVADIESLPFADSPFDAVLANRVLYHVPDLDRGLREIVRVLRPGGCLVAVTYSERHLEELAGLLDRPLIASTFSAESGPPAIERHLGRVHSEEVVGAAVFRSADALHGFAAQQFGLPVASTPDRLGDVPLPFRATYRHCVIVGTTPA
jgi:SAM-dependent methyltransferase